MDWWKDLQQTYENEATGTLLVRGKHLLSFLAQSGQTFDLRGVGGVGDPLLNQALEDAIEISQKAGFDANESFSNDHHPIGAIDLGGVVMVAMEDPTDGLRSVCDYWVLMPGALLRTQLPNIPVVIQPSDTSDWDPSLEDKETSPRMIDVVPILTNDVLVSMGTKYGDEYYPCATFRHQPQAMTMAAVESTHDALTLHTVQASSSRPSPRL